MEGTCFRQMTLSPTIWTWTTVWHSIWCPEVKLATWLNQSAHILTEGHYIWMSHKLSCFALLYEQILPESPTRGLTVINTNGFANFRKFKCPVTLTLLGAGQGHISIHSACRTNCRPNHVTVALRSTEIWPFECRQISILEEVWTLMIAFLDGNSKIWLRQAVVQVHAMATDHQFWAPRRNGGGDRPRKVHFSQLWKLRDLDLRSGRGHTGAHMWSRSNHTPN